MQTLVLRKSDFPASEELQYDLKMIGAKGSVKLTEKIHESGVEIKCQVLASLVLPPKKLVDNEITSKLEEIDGELMLIRYADNDYKAESKRTIEVKKKLIETKFIKFEEERGYLEYPETLIPQELMDPFSAIYSARSKNFLSGSGLTKVSVLLRSGVLEVGVKKTETRISDAPAFGGERSQIRVTLHKLAGGEIKGPYLSEDMELWLDAETGIITEITYPFLGAFGKASLFLSSRVVS